MYVTVYTCTTLVIKDMSENVMQTFLALQCNSCYNVWYDPQNLPYDEHKADRFALEAVNCSTPSVNKPEISLKHSVIVKLWTANILTFNNT